MRTRIHPQFKLWICTNHKPEIRGVDEGVWRRLRLIPFTVQVPERDRDPQLPAKLRAEAAGILAWMVEGCLDWQRGGLRSPAAVIAATSEWRTEANDVAAFVDARCVVGDFAKTKTGALYAAFREWAAGQGAEPMSSKAFAQRLARLIEAMKARNAADIELRALREPDGTEHSPLNQQAVTHGLTLRLNKDFASRHLDRGGMTFERVLVGGDEQGNPIASFQVTVVAQPNQSAQGPE